MQQIIHEGHTGIAKCRSRADQALYWPKISVDIHKMVSNCDTCQLCQYKQRKEPLRQHDVAGTPWVKIGTDLFTLNGADYLIVVDYTSKIAGNCQAPWYYFKARDSCVEINYCNIRDTKDRILR